MTTTDPARPAVGAIDPVERRLRRLEDLLARYPVKHRGMCAKSIWTDPPTVNVPCTCGLDRILQELRAEGRG